MRKPYFTFETQNTSVLFKDMQKNATSSAIVIDEYGSVAGFITTQDLIEEIIGEIRDEYDLEGNEPFVQIVGEQCKASKDHIDLMISTRLSAHSS